MYFINEKAGAMSASGHPVKLETGLPALYRAQRSDPDKKIIVWRDNCGNIHAETIYNNVDKIIEAIQKFEKGEDY